MIKNIIWEIKKIRKHKKKIIFILFLFLVIALTLLYFSSKLNFAYLDYDFYLPKKEIVLENEFLGKVYFNDEIGGSQFKNLIIESIENAKQSIDLFLYSLDMDEIADSLLLAQKRGVDVNLIFDQSKKNQHDRVFGENFKFNILNMGGDIDKGGDYMHHKFVIFDKNTDKAKLLFGSFNYTALQEKYDPSFILETEDQDVINAFVQENDLISQGIRGYKKIRENSYKPFNRKIQYNNGFVEIWFSPGFQKNSIKQRMIDLIASAENNIDIIIWRATDDDIIKKILTKAQEGVKVRIITDDYYIWSNDSVFKKLARIIKESKIKNIEIVSDLYRTLDFHNKIQTEKSYFNPYIHQHTLIVDNKIVLSGTNNWTYNGFFKNDESIMISDVDFWVNGFRNSFQKHYSDLKNQNIGFSQENNLVALMDNPDFLGQRLLIYNELSEEEKAPERCFEIDILEKDFSFNISQKCNTMQTLLFILDNDNNLIASDYLDF